MTARHPNSKPLPSHAILSAEERAMLAAYVEEQTQQSQWPFDQAAKVTGLPAELLRKLVRDGVLTGKAAWRMPEVMGWCDIDQAREIAAKLNAARTPVEGKGILATEAAEKYGFSAETIYAWYKNDWVKVIGNTQNRRNRLFNEGDIAFARALADLTGQAQGKPVFPPKSYTRKPKS
jgi:hypothetical protein